MAGCTMARKLTGNAEGLGSALADAELYLLRDIGIDPDLMGGEFHPIFSGIMGVSPFEGSPDASGPKPETAWKTERLPVSRIAGMQRHH